MPRKKSTTSRTTRRTTRRKQSAKSSQAEPLSPSTQLEPVDSDVVEENKTTEGASKELLALDVNDSPLDEHSEPIAEAESSSVTDESSEIDIESDIAEIDDGQLEPDDYDREVHSNTAEQGEVDASDVEINQVTRQSNQAIEDDVPGVSVEHLDDQDASRAVEVVVDRRSPEPENPLPIHPMDAMTAQLSEPIAESLSAGDLASSDVETVTVEAIEATVEALNSDDSKASVLIVDDGVSRDAVDAVVVEAVEVDSEGSTRTLSGPMVDELNEAIATAHRHEEALESQISAIQEHENQLKQQVADAKKDAKRFAKDLAEADRREEVLKEEIADLKELLSKANTQAMQAQSQLNDQDKNQREIGKLKGEVTTLKSELDEAKRYILQLTDQLTDAQALAQRQSSVQPQPQSSTTFPPPLTQRPPHTRVVGSPRPLPRRPAPRPIAPAPAASGSPRPSGLPPMSTERFTDSASITPSPPSRTLRKAYTRPGFSTPQAPLDPSNTSAPTSDPMPPLESIPREGAASSSAQPKAAIIPKKSSPIVQRRSRYDDLKPELKSSNLPQPKVSDAEIGWFD